MKKSQAIAAAAMLATVLIGSHAVCAGSCTEATGFTQRLRTETMLEDVAMTHSLDPALLSAIAQVESRECSDAISSKGAAGLMQLMPATASEFGVEDRFDPLQNALGAARFIDYLQRERAEGKLSLPEIVAAYNAGEGAVTRAHGVPHYRETEAYVRRVLWTYLIGYVPRSARASEVAPSASSPGPVRMHATRSRTAAGSDGAVLERLAELRRARQAAQSVPAVK